MLFQSNEPHVSVAAICYRHTWCTDSTHWTTHIRYSDHTTAYFKIRVKAVQWLVGRLDDPSFDTTLWQNVSLLFPLI